MRQVLSVSLPEMAVKTIKLKTKKRGFENVSEYIKYLLSLDDDYDWISEAQLLEDIKIARKEYKKGKTIKANSIADLL